MTRCLKKLLLDMWSQELTEYSEIDFQHQVCTLVVCQAALSRCAWVRQGRKTSCCNVCKRQGKACKTCSVLSRPHCQETAQAASAPQEMIPSFLVPLRERRLTILWRSECRRWFSSLENIPRVDVGFSSEPFSHHKFALLVRTNGGVPAEHTRASRTSDLSEGRVTWSNG